MKKYFLFTPIVLSLSLHTLHAMEHSPCPNDSQEQNHALEEEFKAELRKFTNFVKNYFTDTLIPQHATALSNPNHQIYITWDVDGTTLDHKKLKSNLHKKIFYPFFYPMPDKWCTSKGFKSIFLTGRFDVLSSDDDKKEANAHHGTFVNLYEEGYEITPNQLHSFPHKLKEDKDNTTPELPNDRLLKHCAEVAAWKESIRTEYTASGCFIAASFDDLKENLKNPITNEVRAYLGIPFHVPNRKRI